MEKQETQSEYKTETLHMSVVQSVLLHGSETWTLTKANTARLQAFHMKAQRRIQHPEHKVA